MSNTSVYCIVGASGAGKDTLVRELMTRYPNAYRKFTSTTNRAPRPGEAHGVDYYYVSDEEYDRWQREGRFLLTTEFAGTRYGTLRSEVEAGDTPLLMIVVEGVAKQIKELLGAAIILIDVDEEEVARRMRSRGDSEESIRARLKADAPRREVMRELADVTIMNQDLSSAVDNFHTYVQSRV
jgi:guanylate kinase